MEHFVWCAIAGQNRLLHIDTTNCAIVYDLKKAALHLSRIKIPYPRVEIWKVKEPHKWPAVGLSSSNEISNDDDDLRMIADLLFPQTKLETIPTEGADTIEFIMKINSKRKTFPSVSVPERCVWCVIASQDRILQVDIAKSKDLGRLKRDIARDAKLPSENLEIWKFKEPQDWPVDDRARRRPFPSNVKDLEDLAEHLSANMESIPYTFFDNVIRKEHIYLLVQISDDLSSGAPISTSNCLAWCGVPGQSRLFQVDVGKYKTRSVYALRDEVLRQSGFRDSECNLWKIKDPQLWPIKDKSPAVDFPDTDASYIAVSELLNGRTPVEEALSEDFHEGSLHLLLTLPSEYEPDEVESESMLCASSVTPAASERLHWCAIAGRGQVLRVDSSRCRLGAELKHAIIDQARLGLVYSQINIWKIIDPRKWAVRDIVLGSAKVPVEKEGLRQIANMYQPYFKVDESFASSTFSEWTELILEIIYEKASASSCSSSSSSAISRSDPFSERQDIQEALKELGFRDDVFQDMDRWHVGDVFTNDGERYVAKYLRPNRCDEIKVLKYVSQFDSSRNHAPSNIISYGLEDGALLLTRHYGDPVHKYEYLSRDLLLIVQQLFEGVEFLHSKRVVHMDLKPSHIIIDSSIRLWIIDFDLSEILENDEETVSGFRGTRGCTAPEVGKVAYSPILADVWAAGNVVAELCALCPSHEARDFLVGLCARLMDRDPKNRPSLQDAYTEVLNHALTIERTSIDCIDQRHS